MAKRLPDPNMPRPKREEAPAQIERATVRRIFSYLGPHLRYVVLVGALLVASAILNLVPPLLVERIVDNAIPEKQFSWLVWLSAGMIAAPLLADVLDVGEKYWTALLGERVKFDLRNQLYRHLHKQPLGYFTSARPGEALSNVLNDVQAVGDVISDKLASLAQNLVVFTATLVMIFTLDWRLVLIALFFLPFFVIPTQQVGRRKKALKRKNQEKLAEFVGMLSETLSISGALLLKVFGTEDQEAKRVETKSREIMDNALDQALLGRWFKLILGFLKSIGPALFWSVGGYLVMEKELKLGALVAAVALLNKLYNPASALAGIYVDFVTSYAVFERIFAVLDTKPAIQDQPGALTLGQAQGAISFRGVSFTYGGDKEVLRSIDLDIKPGQSVALVGPSGSGKSTLAALVARLYDPSQGAITLDGHDLKALTLQSLRAQIGVVTQETFLFHTTIGENLRYGRPDASQEEVVEAAKAAQIHALIETLPEKYDTLVGDRGYRLSGGERQRVAIARAILRDPPILILDEATSALDSHNEALIQTALRTLQQGRTSLVIAHRLSTIQDADQIIVLEKGKVAERGTHGELLQAQGLYASLWHEQFS